MPLLYDLCCGGGGVTQIAREMGFDVVGVDFKPQSDYVGDFILADALHPPLQPCADVVWVSPYCQGYSRLHYFLPHIAKSRQVNEFRQVARSMGRLYIIENVDTCYDLIDPVRLCGKMFGYPIIRHRKFETNFLLPQPAHMRHDMDWMRVHYKARGSCEEMSRAMGLTGLKRYSLSQAVPRCYTEYVLTWAKIALAGLQECKND